MAEDPEVTRLSEMRSDAVDLYRAAEEKKDEAGKAAAIKIITEIDLAMMRHTTGVLEGLATRLAALRAKIDEASDAGNKWSPVNPLDGAERFFRDDVPANDDDDPGPDIPADGNAKKRSKVVPSPSDPWTSEYLQLWTSMEISEPWRRRASTIVDKLIVAQQEYVKAVKGTQVPWWFIGVIHSLESDLDFKSHLHNGDSLRARTIRKPPGRPPTPDPPYSWYQSAADAISLKDFHLIQDWSLASTLYNWHRYNGIANEYKRRGIPTPYLWSGSQHYVKGKYVSDGDFDPDAVSKQVGGAVLLRTLIEKGVVSDFDEKTQPEANVLSVAGDARVLKVDRAALPGHLQDELVVPHGIAVGSKDSGESLDVRRVQEWLTFHEFATPIDGTFGDATDRQLTRFKEDRGRDGSGPLDQEVWNLLVAPLLRAVAPTGISSSEALEQAVLMVAAQHVGQKPKELGGNNCGPWVRLYMEGNQGSTQKWCAGFVCFVIEQAARELGISLPWARQVSVNALVRDAKREKRFISAGDVTTAAARKSKIRPGNLFVIRSANTNWTHTGIVLQVNDTTFETIEGNTGGDGGTDGDVARQLTRNFRDKDFINLF